MTLRDDDLSTAADADAKVRFGGSPDRMKIGVSRYTSARGAGQPLSVEMLRSALAKAGVAARLDEAKAVEAVRLLLAGQDASHIVIARGQRPRSAQDAWVEMAGAQGYPVFPGQVIGTLHPAVPSQEGRDVAGNPVSPEDRHEPRTLSAGPGIGLDRDGGLTAQVAGIAHIRNGVVELTPLFSVSADRLQALATLHPRDAQGREVTPEAVALALAAQGVGFGVQMEAIAAGLAQAKAGGKAVEGVVAALGQAPAHGTNGRLELLCGEQACPLPEDDRAKVDYRARSLFVVAVQGQDIARLHPPAKGVPGRDVTGAEIPARDGAALGVQLGKNVEAVDNGSVFRARMAGVVLAGKASLDISELLTIPGDVDYGTGNIQLTQGSLQVGGTVRTGFTVQVPGKVLVQGMVESARILAGSDVVVRGGIFMSGDDTAYVESGGTLTAAFTHNAQIKAAGDVTVALSMVGSKANKGSRVTSGGFVRVTDPKGRIMGGAVVCARGMEVFDAGSERGMATTLALNVETPEILALIKEQRELKVLRQQAVFVVGEGDGAAALSRLFNERRQEAEELLSRREGIEARLKQIQRSLAELAQEHLERVANARITVRGTAHPGVAIKMGGRSLYVERALVGCVFSWDAQNKEIVTGSL